MKNLIEIIESLSDYINELEELIDGPVDVQEILDANNVESPNFEKIGIELEKHKLDMKNAKVELNKYTTEINKVMIHEITINGVQTLLSKEQYEAIEKTL